MKPTKIASKDQQIKCLLNEINILKQHLTPVEIADYEQRLHAKFLQKRHNSDGINFFENIPKTHNTVTITGCIGSNKTTISEVIQRQLQDRLSNFKEQRLEHKTILTFELNRLTDEN